ncbi:hypothetical protein C8J56DRAFT_768499, partial [Mycena floridula]
MSTRVPAIRQDVPADDPALNVDHKLIAEKWQLNESQKLAFDLIVGQSRKNGCDEPLRMLLSGAGGTGKSQVINACSDYFEKTRESRRLRLASFTGVAARNIQGMTLHAALGLSQWGAGK